LSTIWPELGLVDREVAVVDVVGVDGGLAIEAVVRLVADEAATAAWEIDASAPEARRSAARSARDQSPVRSGWPLASLQSVAALEMHVGNSGVGTFALIWRPRRLPR